MLQALCGVGELESMYRRWIKGDSEWCCAQIVYYDGQFNDSRLNVALAQTAALAGATVLNYAEVTRLIKVPLSLRRP